MKRRSFIQNMGLGLPPLVVSSPTPWNLGRNGLPEYFHRQPETLNDVVTRDGNVIVRLEFQSEGRYVQRLQPEILVEKGRVQHRKSYFFEAGEDHYSGEVKNPVITTSLSDTDVLVLWLDRFSEETTISVTEKPHSFSFTLAGLVKNLEAIGKIGDTAVKANLLSDKEIGGLNPPEAGINVTGDDFVFIIMADPQGGDVTLHDGNTCRMKIHNAFVEESIRVANTLKVKPAFCLMLGDIVDHQGETGHFVQMAKFFSGLKMPVLYEMGNHESRYNASFGPGYNLSAFNNYFAAQKAINGMEKLLYSFDLGKWHFIVWPDPLRRTFWENHPHYFDWLARDLEKNKERPTLFFQHIPMHPMGINPLDTYSESVDVKRLLFDILTKHGNVKTIFSGHVHIPVKSSFKTAMSVRGINCINLPAAGYRPRAFGEEDYSGGPAQGICIVDIKGVEMSVTYKTVTHEEYQYPDTLPAFDESKYPLWLGHKWELPVNRQFVNGDFAVGLKGWGRSYVFSEDKNPSNICRALKPGTGGNAPALYLMTRKRGFHTPGQDRLPQDINRVFQAVELEEGKWPVIAFDYLLEGKNCDFTGYNGLYIWIEGFRKSAHLVNLLYFANKGFASLGSTYARQTGTAPLFFSLNNVPDVWHKVQLNIARDFESNAQGLKFGGPAPDRLVVSAGIWNINDGREQPFAAFLRNFRLDYNQNLPSLINGKQIGPLPETSKWWQGKTVPWGNVAGEHHYHVEGWNELKY